MFGITLPKLFAHIKEGDLPRALFVQIEEGHVLVVRPAANPGLVGDFSHYNILEPGLALTLPFELFGHDVVGCLDVLRWRDIDPPDIRVNTSVGDPLQLIDKISKLEAALKAKGETTLDGIQRLRRRVGELAAQRHASGAPHVLVDMTGRFKILYSTKDRVETEGPCRALIMTKPEEWGKDLTKNLTIALSRVFAGMSVENALTMDRTARDEAVKRVNEIVNEGTDGGSKKPVEGVVSARDLGLVSMFQIEKVSPTPEILRAIEMEETKERESSAMERLVQSVDKVQNHSQAAVLVGMMVTEAMKMGGFGLNFGANMGGKSGGDSGGKKK